MLKWLAHNRVGVWWATRRGESMGEDDLGNQYYRKPRGSDWRDEKRWVVFAGAEPDPTTVPAGWYGWLHHRFEKAPSELELRSPDWSAEHTPNMTGTVDAYFPDGHQSRGGKRAGATGDYEAWRPE